MSDWGSRARIAELEKQVKDTENRFQLMLQEREHFARQIRAVRWNFEELKDDPDELLDVLERILAEPNPVYS